MKVTLIRPPKISSQSAPKTHGGVPPLGIAYIAAALRDAGHAVDIIDAFGEAPDQTTEFADGRLQAVGLSARQIRERVDPVSGLIGVTAMFSQEWIYTTRVLEQLESLDIPVVLGGEHATALPGYILATCPNVVACAHGEGEATMVDIAAAVESGTSLQHVSGLTMRGDAGTAHFTGPRARRKTLDNMARPAWDLVPIETYLDRRFAYEEKRQRTMPMLATRGCPYKCTFCSNEQMWGIQWIARSPQNVIDEIKDYIDRYDIEHVEFYDLTAIVDRRWIIEFTERLIAQHVRISWRMPSGTRSEALDRDVIALLKRSGCVGIVYAPESGSPTTLRRIKKKTTPQKMLRSMRAAVKEGMHVRAHFIVGLPGQTLKEILETYWFIFRLALNGVYDVNVFAFFPYPGTELFDQLVNDSTIDPEADDFDQFLARACFTDMQDIESWNRTLSPAFIKALCLTGMGLFYATQFLVRPVRFVRMVYRVGRGRPFTWFERYVHASLTS